MSSHIILLNLISPNNVTSEVEIRAFKISLISKYFRQDFVARSLHTLCRFFNNGAHFSLL
jgi:hypothetical protein